MHKKGKKTEAGVVNIVTSRKTNREIIEGLKNGDNDAAIALYDQFGKLINRMVSRILGYDPEHDDVVHQAFANVISSIGTIANPDKLGVWIAQVTVNTVKKELQSRKIRSFFHLKPEMSDLPSDSFHQEKQLFVRRFYEVIDELGPRDRIMFLLRFVDGMKIREIAALCGCSVSTAKRRIAHAHKIFRRRAEKDSILASFLEETT